MNTGFVLDCSYVMACLVREEHSDWAEPQLASMKGSELWAPQLMQVEIVSSLHSAHRRKRISEAQQQSALASAGVFPIRYDSHWPSLSQIEALSSQYQLTPYDALYLDLGLRRKLPLVSFDQALLKAARSAGLATVTAP